MSDLSFWKVGSMRVLGGRIVLVEGQSRKRPTGYVQEQAKTAKKANILFCNVDVRLRPARTIPFAGPPAALVGRGDAAAALRRCRLDRRDPIVRGGATDSAGRGPAPVAR